MPWPKGYKKKVDQDILDWLQAMFGFQVSVTFFLSLNSFVMIHYHLVNAQKDNVANQREHLILLLANGHIRQVQKLDQQPKVLTSQITLAYDLNL